MIISSFYSSHIFIIFIPTRVNFFFICFSSFFYINNRIRKSTAIIIDSTYIHVLVDVCYYVRIKCCDSHHVNRYNKNFTTYKYSYVCFSILALQFFVFIDFKILLPCRFLNIFGRLASLNKDLKTIYFSCPSWNKMYSI